MDGNRWKKSLKRKFDHEKIDWNTEEKNVENKKNLREHLGHGEKSNL